MTHDSTLAKGRAWMRLCFCIISHHSPLGPFSSLFQLSLFEFRKCDTLDAKHFGTATSSCGGVKFGYVRGGTLMLVYLKGCAGTFLGGLVVGPKAVPWLPEPVILGLQSLSTCSPEGHPPPNLR